MDRRQPQSGWSKPETPVTNFPNSRPNVEVDGGLMSTLSVHSVVQDLASDATILLSIFYSITPGDLDEFIYHFSRLLVRGSEVNALATSEVISELLTLELDRALWKLGDSTYFMKEDGSIARLVQAMAKLSVTLPNGPYVAQLMGMFRSLCDQHHGSTVSADGEDDDAEQEEEAPGSTTPQGYSFTDETVPGDILDRFSTSELAGLAAAEQQFLLELAHTPSYNGSFSNLVGAEVPTQRQHHPEHSSASSSCANNRKMQNFSFLMSRSQKMTEKEVELREALDYFALLEVPMGNAEDAQSPVSTDIIPVYDETTAQKNADLVKLFCLRVIDVSISVVNEWPEALRQALWMIMRAISGAGVSSTAPIMVYGEDAIYTIEYKAMATIVVHLIIIPALQSLPQNIVGAEVRVNDSTQRRFDWVCTFLESAAYAKTYTPSSNAAYKELNAVCAKLTDHWVTFFLKVTKYHQMPALLWAIPTQSGFDATALSVDQELALSFFEQCDRSLVAFLHTSMLLRPLTEAVHASVWMRFTRYLQRVNLGRIKKSFEVKIGALKGTGDNTVMGSFATAGTALDGARTDDGILSEDQFRQEEDKDLLDGNQLLQKSAFVHYVSAKSEDPMQTPLTPVVVSQADTKEFNSNGDTHNCDETIELYEVLEELLTYAYLSLHGAKNNVLLSNFCSIAGCDASGAAVVMLYGDLLSCYLHNYYYNEEGNTRRFLDCCPHFAKFWEREGNKEWKDGDAIAIIFLTIDLAIQHNSRTNSYYFVWIKEEDDATNSLGAAWVLSMLSYLPLKYKQCLKRLIFVKSQGNSAFKEVDMEEFAGVLFISDFADLPQMLPEVTTYLPLSALDYNRVQQMETNRVQQEKAAAAAAAGTQTGGGSSSPSQLGEMDVDEREASLKLQEHWERLRGRWSRSLAAANYMQQQEIWPLRTTLSFFEIICTASCRREWSDGRLRPMLGVPSIGLGDVYQFVVEFYVGYQHGYLDYIGTEPNWRDVSTDTVDAAFQTDGVGMPPRRTTASNTSNGTSNGSTVCARIASEAPRYWGHRTWLYVGDTERNAGHRHAYDATLQRLFFLWNEQDVTVRGGSYNDAAVSVCWGIDSYRFRPEAKNGDGDREQKSASFEEAVQRMRGSGLVEDAASNYSLSQMDAKSTSATSRLIPSSRHMTLQSVWRLLLFNVSRTCEVVRTKTPEACPFTRMMNAIASSLESIDTKPVAKHQRSTQNEMIRVAAKALRTCSPAEVDLVCLVVAIVSYVRNMDNMRRRVSSVELQRVTLQGYIQGTAQLVLGRAVEYEPESRLMEILAGDGKELMENAQLRYFESCTWHPYSKLLYNAKSN